MKFLKIVLGIALLGTLLYTPDAKPREDITFTIAAAKDPHTHVGSNTYCYNLEDNICDTDAAEKGEGGEEEY